MVQIAILYLNPKFDWYLPITGLIPDVMHMSHWPHQERHLASVAPCATEARLYIWDCQNLHNEGIVL